MSTFRRLLLAAPLLMLTFATAARAQEEETPDPPPIPRSMPPGMACYQKCNYGMVTCQKDCGKTARCTQQCTKQLATCTDACGGPPAPPEQQQ